MPGTGDTATLDRGLRVAMISGARSGEASGLPLAEAQLISALRRRPDVRVSVRIPGGRAARRYAHAIGGDWYPANPSAAPKRAWRGADVIHLVGLDFPPPRGDVPYVMNLYDVASGVFADESPFPAWSAEAVRRATHIIASTESGARDIASFFGCGMDKMRVVPLGPGQVTPETRMTAQELTELGLRHPLVLRIGGWTTRKNVPVLLDAWPAVQRSTGAVLALVGPSQTRRDDLLAAAPDQTGIVVLSALPSRVLSRLLHSADVLVSPSIYEGFGLPPLEAMAAGSPVVAVRNGSTEEVCGDAALLVENDSRALAEALVRVLSDPEQARSLRQAGRKRASEFSWSNTAADTVAVYREALEAT